MYRKPPEDDEQPQEIPVSYPRQRRRQAIANQHQLNQHHPYEPPAAPQIRRASLVNQQPPPPNRASNWRQQPSLKDRSQSPHHKRTILLVGSLVILILLVPSAVILATRFSLYPSSTNATLNLNGSTSVKGTSIAVNQPPMGPHEIVIIPSDTDHPPPPVFAQSAYLMDADTGATLYAYNPFRHIPPMSTTKLMTAVIALEIGNPAQKITITNAIDHDINQLSPDSSLFGVKKGETYTLSDLLYGLLLMSGNDAAVAIADGLSGNIQNFVARMNQKALQLGMYDTHYMNPHGLLDPDHYSSAHDLALIGRYSMSIPLIHQITGTKEYHLPPGKHLDRDLINDDQFLWWYPGVDGGKPGWDAATNYVQVISCTRNHHHLIGVIMHSSNFWTDMRDLLNWGFDDFTWISPHDVSLQRFVPYSVDSNYFAADKQDTTIPTADRGRYYIYTGFSISGPIMAYFDHGGGLKKFGYPISLPSISSTLLTSQRFQHATIQCSLATTQCTTT